VNKIAWVYPLVFLAATGWYAMASHGLARTGSVQLDSTVVSEQIIACGIASLIGQVAIAVFTTGAGLATGKPLSVDSILSAANLFAEGLACAAIAPLVAMILRFADSPEKRLDRELDQLTKASVGFNDFSQKATNLGLHMDQFAGVIGQSAVTYEAAVGNVGAALGRMEEGITVRAAGVRAQLADLEASTRALGDAITRTTAELRQVGADVSNVYTSTDQAIRGLAARVDELSARMSASGELLQGLNAIIASVNEFVRPAQQGASPSKAADP
jgi:methyl-accepting chemotaxis protein